jgi:leucyl aminopeptidase
MKKIDIFLISKQEVVVNPEILLNSHSIIIKINIFNLSNYNLNKHLIKIGDLIKVYDLITRINIIFDSKLNLIVINKILSRLSDILYKYYKNTKQIKLYQVTNESVLFMDELTRYKDIVMNPNKNPDIYLEYIKTNVPDKYNINIKKLEEDGIFPLTYAVGKGANYSSYFVHIQPKTIVNENKDLFLIGKAVTFDAGGLNLKTSSIEKMKVDMTGSAIILSVLKLLSSNNYDNQLNIHLLIPIVENMISSKAIKPGAVIKTMNNKTVEITNTDAEGRLCIVDCIEWINMKLLRSPNSLILDIATLTGNTVQITSGISSILMSNNSGLKYAKQIMKISENIGEYLDYLKLREEYMDMLLTPVADIKNVNLDIKAGCIIGGTFISHFVNETPWLHIDLGIATFMNSIALSHGINLLYEFIKELKN